MWEIHHNLHQIRYLFRYLLCHCFFLEMLCHNHHKSHSSMGYTYKRRFEQQPLVNYLMPKLSAVLQHEHVDHRFYFSASRHCSPDSRSQVFIVIGWIFYALNPFRGGKGRGGDADSSPDDELFARQSRKKKWGRSTTKQVVWETHQCKKCLMSKCWNNYFLIIDEIKFNRFQSSLSLRQSRSNVIQKWLFSG